METTSDALQRATELASILSKSLAPAVDPRTVSRLAKIPFKALLLRELLMYRVAELSTNACELFRSGQTIAATTLTRAALEPIAWLFVLDRRIQKCLDEKDLGTFPDFVNRLLFGGRGPDDELKAYNILNALDEVDKHIPHFRVAYDTCCEFAHPNADGMIRSYGRMDRETLLFNLDPKKYQIPVDGIVPILAAGLEMFIDIYDRMPPYLLDFAKLCEADIRSGET